MPNFLRSRSPVQAQGLGPAFHSKSSAPAPQDASGLSISIGAKICTAVLLLIGSACQRPAPAASDVAMALQNLSELATVEYTVTKVVAANDDVDWYKLGERKVLITCQATIKAGINLKEIDAAQVVINGRSISLRLPPPKILSVNLPPGKHKSGLAASGLFTRQLYRHRNQCPYGAGRTANVERRQYCGH